MDIFFGKSKDPASYYFKYSTSGAKVYFEILLRKSINRNSSANVRRIAKKNIPAEIIDQIKEQCCELDDATAILTRQGLARQIEQMQEKVAEIDLKLQKKCIFKENYTEFLLQKEKYDEYIKSQQDARDKEWNDLLKKHRAFFEKAYDQHKATQSSSIPRRDPAVILKDHNIYSNQDWKEWFKKNHPDKGGDIDICQTVITAGRGMGW